jgi:hypothetical protein
MRWMMWRAVIGRPDVQALMAGYHGRAAQLDRIKLVLKPPMASELETEI